MDTLSTQLMHHPRMSHEPMRPSNNIKYVIPPKTTSGIQDLKGVTKPATSWNQHELTMICSTPPTLELALGLRKGEVLGLSWDDISPEVGELTIRYQRQRARQQLLHRETKTATSDNTALPMVGLCTAALRYR